MIKRIKQALKLATLNNTTNLYIFMSVACGVLLAVVSVLQELHFGFSAVRSYQWISQHSCEF